MGNAHRTPDPNTEDFAYLRYVRESPGNILPIALKVYLQMALEISSKQP
jgi:hypothetical protein